MPETSAVYIEFYDDEIDLVEVGDTEYFEIFDEGLTLQVLASESIPFTQQGPLETMIGASSYPITGGTFTIQSVAARVTTAPTGAAVIVDINKNGTTIYGTQSNRPTISSGNNLAVVGAHSVSSLSDGDFLTVDIDQVGSGSPGETLVVVIRLQRIA